MPLPRPTETDSDRSELLMELWGLLLRTPTPVLRAYRPVIASHAQAAARRGGRQPPEHAEGPIRLHADSQRAEGEGHRGFASVACGDQAAGSRREPTLRLNWEGAGL